MISSLALGCRHPFRWMDGDNPPKHRSSTLPKRCRVDARHTLVSNAGMDIAIVKTVTRGPPGAPNAA
jgi:hypothetical protein